MQVALQPDSPYLDLFKYLVQHWDLICSEHGPGLHQIQTRVQSSVLVGNGRYLCATLANNRFCCRKGASHKSNSIYMVIDLVRQVFYQKCHDVMDCGRSFRSAEQAVPCGLLPPFREDADANPTPAAMPQEHLSQRVEETQAILSQWDCASQQTLVLSDTPPHSHFELLTQPPRLGSCSPMEPTLVMLTPPDLRTPPAKPTVTSRDVGATPARCRLARSAPS